MTQIYTDPTREPDPYALPDAEVFYRTKRENRADGWVDGDGETLPAGWYWWSCLPGCLPDGEADGPYATEAEATEAARSE